MAKNPRIEKLKNQGLNKTQIVKELTGKGPLQGGAAQLTAGQLRAIGFGDAFINNVKGGGGGAGGGSYTIAPPSTGGSGGWNQDALAGMDPWKAPPTSTTGGGGSIWNPPSTPGAPAPPSAPAIEWNQSAYDIMRQMLDQYGLGSLSGVLRNLIERGITDQASVMLELQNTAEWKQRFAGNEMLRQRGLGVLSPAEYLAVERSYAQVLRNYGLPEGFYDDPSDFAGFIGHQVSAAELQQRAQAYADLANREDSAIKDQLRAMGLGQGDLIAYMMDPNRAAPLIQRKYQTVLLSAAARRQGLGVDTEYAGRLAELGITEGDAIRGYGAIRAGLHTFETLGDIYGTAFGQRDYEREVFEADGQAARKRQGLASQERAAFSGRSGLDGRTLARDRAAGRF